MHWTTFDQMQLAQSQKFDIKMSENVNMYKLHWDGDAECGQCDQ
jgi:hypothetical protein